MKSFWGASMLALMVSAVPAMAQEADGKPVQLAAADTDGRGTIIVTGQRTKNETVGTALFGAGDRRDVPFSISVVDSELLNARLPRNISEALLTEPSVTNSYGGSGLYPTESFNVRGFELGGGDSFLVDGSPIAGQVTQSLDNKERIEVLLGPAAFRYGFLPPGGAVNLVSKLPTDEPFAKLSANTDNWGTFKVHGDVGGRIGEGGLFGYRINASLFLQDTFVEPIESRRLFYSGTFDFRPSETTTITLSFDRLDSNIHGDMFHYTRPTITGNVLKGIKPTDYWGQRWADWFSTYTNASLRVDSELADWLTLSSTTAYFHQHQNTNLTIPENVQDNGNFTISESRGGYDGKKYMNTSYLQAEFGADETMHHTLATGFTIKQTDAQSRAGGGAMTIGTSNFYNPVQVAPQKTIGAFSRQLSQREFGAFVSDQITFSNVWHVLLGLRYSSYNIERYNLVTKALQDVRKEHAITPAVGLMFDVTPELRLYSSFAKGLELGGIAPVNAVNANEPQKPIKSKQIEAGLKAKLLGGQLGIDAAVFKITKDSEFLNPATNIYGPLGTQRHIGGEIRVYGHVTPNLSVSGGMQYLDAKLTRTSSPLTLGDTPYNTPKFSAVAYADYEIPGLSGVFVNGSAKYVGRREVNVPNTAQAPAYVRFDTGIRYEGKIGNQEITARIAIENVANKTYYVAAWANLFEYGAPRTASFSVNLKF